MAPPPSKFLMIALLVVAFSISATSSSAAEGKESAAGKSAAAAAVAAPAPAPPRGSGASQETRLEWFLTPDFPCFPFLPKLLLDLCHLLFPPPSPPPPSTYCRAPLTEKVVPSCAPFLTNASVAAPPADCCDAMRSFVDPGSNNISPLCLCHVVNGDVLSAPPVVVNKNQTRGLDAVVACNVVGLDAEMIAVICDPKNGGILPPLDPPKPNSPPPPPPPMSCRAPLTEKLVPSCVPFLTNASVDEPSSECCSAMRSFVDGRTPDDGDQALCLCHVANDDDVREILPAQPVPGNENRTRGLDALLACYVAPGLNAGQIADVCDLKYGGTLPPMDPPKPKSAPPAPART